MIVCVRSVVDGDGRPCLPIDQFVALWLIRMVTRTVIAHRRGILQRGPPTRLKLTHTSALTASAVILVIFDKCAKRGTPSSILQKWIIWLRLLLLIIDQSRCASFWLRECVAQPFASKFVQRLLGAIRFELLVSELRYFLSGILFIWWWRKMLKLMINCLKIHSLPTFRVHWARRCKLIFHFFNRIIVLIWARNSLREISLLRDRC